MQDLYDVVDKEHVPRRNDKPDGGKVTTGEQACPQVARQSACCRVRMDPYPGKHVLWMLWGSVGVGWGGVEGLQRWAAAVCQYGSSSVVSTAMAPVVLSSHSWAVLFQLSRPQLPTSSGCKPEPPVL